MSKHIYPLGMLALAVLAFVLLAPGHVWVGTAQSGPVCPAPDPGGERQ